MKVIQRLFLVIEQRPLNIVPIGTGLGMSCDRRWQGRGKLNKHLPPAQNKKIEIKIYIYMVQNIGTKNYNYYYFF
jgi:hypothetical protein